MPIHTPHMSQPGRIRPLHPVAGPVPHQPPHQYGEDPSLEKSEALVGRDRRSGRTRAGEICAESQGVRLTCGIQDRQRITGLG